MPIVRLIVAWLLLLALPLQGIAAASMVFCHKAPASAAVHDEHGAHGHHHPGGDHDHPHHPAGSAGHGLAAAPDGGSAEHVSLQAGDNPEAQAQHKCAICASCCQVVAIPETLSIVTSAETLSADLPQLHVPVLSRASPRPDKPPRA